MNKSILQLALLLIAFSNYGQKNNSKSSEPVKSILDGNTSAFQFRLVGPALTSGRVADMAVHPKNSDVWYIAAASGGIWKTTNHGTTFDPIFDHYGSFSTACVELAPSNPNTVWVGTGENNNQRSVAYGDGVYKSLDGGATFINMGLKNSEHIGNIIIHPTDENIVWVAAYGPVWSAGGDRGVYKTIDGGKTWKKTLFVSEETGIAEIAIDPKNPSIIYAAAHQRRRHEWTYIGGGPESTIYKSTDGGETWREINSGLPLKSMGRIGIAVAPADENVLYAIVEARENKGGVFKSTNKGENWVKMSGYSTSGNYYQEIICDPINKEKVFSMDTWLHHSDDGGKTFKATGEDKKHVDNHAMWIDPNNTDHWLVGCDGGIYETYNHAKDWKYYDNLPIIQFYKVATDNAVPFYNIYGGTQDNNSMGGPSRTINSGGVLNSDWFITNGGDGFESAIDPTDPNTSYAQAQYGWLVRYNKLSGEKIAIQPLPKKGESAYRWNWDAPLLISPHDHKTLYFAANRVFKSSNRGDDWQTISPDLTQQIDRNKLEVMGQVWSMDAVMKNASTTIYGNVVALDESPKKKGLLYAGTDDGIIQISENDGENWSKQSAFIGIPAHTRVNQLHTSPTDENVVYAVFNNHRLGDFKPYILKSINKGKTWFSITGNLPTRGSAYTIRQDFLDDKLLFVGTEFGCYFSNDAGKTWNKLAGLPTIAVYDLDIQKRENDLVAATFGRGFYVLDDYTGLRQMNADNLNKKAHLFPIKDAWVYEPAVPLGLKGTGSQGANLWNADNPEFGAVFTLFLKDEYKTLSEVRKEAEKAKEEKKEDVFYPNIDAIRLEEKDEKTKLIWVIRDESGKEIRRLNSSPTKGTSKMTWDLTKEATTPIVLQKHKPGRYEDAEKGFLATEGNYSVEVLLLKNGISENLVEKTHFKIKNLNNIQLDKNSDTELTLFRSEVADFVRIVSGTNELLSETEDKLKYMEIAILNYPNADLTWMKEIKEIQSILSACKTALFGDQSLASREFETLPSINERLGITEYQLSSNYRGVTKTEKENLELVKEEYVPMRAQLDLAITRLKQLDEKLSKVPIPYTKGAGSDWKQY